jgi:hypothetical protein
MSVRRRIIAERLARDERLKAGGEAFDRGLREGIAAVRRIAEERAGSEGKCNACAGSGVTRVCCGSFESTDHGILGQEIHCCGYPEQDHCDACDGLGFSGRRA